MTYTTKLSSPICPLLLASDGISLTGLWLQDQKYYASTIEDETEYRPDLPVFLQTAAWLEAYFSAVMLPPLPPLAPKGSPFGTDETSGIQ